MTTDITVTSATHPKAVIDRKHIMKQRQSGKDYVLYAGLLDAAHSMGLKGITTLLVHIPSPQNQVAIVHATVEMPWGTFTALGDASPSDPNPVAKNAPIRMAETRAKARAIRDAINASDYEVDDDLPATVDAETGEITRSSSGVAPRKVGPIQAAVEAHDALEDARLRWGKLEQKLYDAGWTKDANESVATGKSLIPSMSKEQWEDEAEIRRIGKATLDQYQRQNNTAGAGGEGDA